MRQSVAADRDLYALLDLKPTAKSNDIRAAYRRAALVAHPDKGGTKEAFHALKLAFEILSCSTTRRLYDQTYTQRLKLRRHQLKRANSCVDSIAPEAKHRRKSASQRTGPCVLTRTQVEVSAVDDALEHMRMLLQSMTAPQRVSAIRTTSSDVRRLLLAFMQKPRTVQPVASRTSSFVKPSRGYKTLKRCVPLSGDSGVRAIHSALGTRYRAHLVIRGLRLYTNTSDYEAAIEHHIIFVQMRDAVAAEAATDPSVWTKPDKLLGIMQGVLIGNGSSEKAIGLHVFVYTRARPWLDNDTYITSPVMRLSEAVSLYARLISAQNESWESLRTQWDSLLQLKQKAPTTKMLPKVDAEKMVDQARQRALHRQFHQAEQRVKRALRHEEFVAQKANALAAREKRRSALAEARALALERKAAKQRKRMWQVRRKLCKCMTMEDIMQGA